MKSILAFLALFIVAPEALAKAPTWAKDCAAAGQKAVTACETIIQDAGADDTAQAVGQSAQLGTGTVIHRGAQAGVNQATGQVSRLKTALGTCEKAKEECTATCEQEEKDRSSRAAGPPQDPIALKAKAQAGQVDAAKQNTCTVPLKGLEAKLAAGLADAGNAGKDSASTRDATPGQMPQMPQNQSKGGSGGGESGSEAANSDKIPTVKAKIADCKIDPTAATLDQCKKELVDSCARIYSAGGGDPKCGQFTAHYCNASASAPPEGGSLEPSASRPGEGIGSHYCNLAVSHEFCADSSRKDCMTCQNYRNFTASECQLNSANCIVNGSQAMADANCKETEPPLSASLFSGLTSPVAGTSGSSRGGSENGSDFGSASVPRHVTATNRGPASATGRARENVSDDMSDLSLFDIGSTAYENMCGQRRLNNCRKK